MSTTCSTAWTPVAKKNSAAEWIPPSDDIRRLLPGGLLRGRYRLTRLLGRGAHGYTYLSRHELLNYDCAVKLLTGPDAVSGAQQRGAEARAGYRVRHPNVVRLLDCDTVGTLWYMVMEFIDGADLESLLATSSPPPWQQAVALLADGARGLEAIHQLGLVHRDIKPGNLILGVDGMVRIADLGVAALLDESVGGHEPAGTFAYAAPEVFELGARADQRADLYGLGATIYHVLTGSPPHAGGGSWASLLDRHGGSPAWPVDSTVPAWLRELIDELLAADPHARLGSATALLARIREAEQPQQSAAATDIDPLPSARGLAVLSFQNSGEDGAESWLGYALADGLARALSRFPGVYVAQQERVREIADRLGSQHGPEEALRRAGRLVGAARLVRGSFRRQRDALTVELEVIPTTDSGCERSAPVVTDSLNNLPQLQDGLLRAAARLLNLVEPGSVGSVAQTHVLEAHRQFVLGKQAYQRGRYAEAIELAQTALRLDPEYVDPLQYAGACAARLGRYEAALEFHQRQERIAEQHGDIRLAVEARANLGVMYYFRGDYAQAFEHCNRAAETAESIGLTAELANIYNNLGFSLLRLGRHAEAQQAYERAIRTHRDYGALESLIGPYNGLGNLLLERCQYAGAAGHFRRALLLAEEVGDRINVGVGQMNLGRAAALAGQPGVAKLELASALATLAGTGFWNGLARVYEYMGEVDMAAGNYAEAARCADQRVELARRHKNAAMEASAWQQKAAALAAAGDSRSAERCREAAARVGDGVTS